MHYTQMKTAHFYDFHCIHIQNIIYLFIHHYHSFIKLSNVAKLIGLLQLVICLRVKHTKALNFSQSWPVLLKYFEAKNTHVDQ